MGLDARTRDGPPLNVLAVGATDAGVLAAIEALMLADCAVVAAEPSAGLPAALEGEAYDAVVLPPGLEVDVAAVRAAAPRVALVECSPGIETEPLLARGLDGRVAPHGARVAVAARIAELSRRRLEIAGWKADASRPHALLVSEAGSAVFGHLAAGLRDHGWEVSVAADGGDALRTLRRIEAHVLVVEGGEPDRVAIARAALRYAPELACQLVAADPSVEETTDHLRSRGLGYRLDPTDPDGLPAVIERSWVQWLSAGPGEHWAAVRTDDEPLQILLVEDSTHVGHTVADQLAASAPGAFVVTRAEDLGTATAQLLDGPGYDLVLVDLDLPDGAGIEAYLRLHHRAPRATYVILTGDDDPRLARLAASCGAQDFLVKGQLGGPELARRLRFAAERSELLDRVRRLADDLQQRDLRLRSLNKSLREANERLEALASVDALTDQLNRRGLERALVAESDRARREGTSLVALLVDCDDFKSINDRLGHAVGDVVLQEMARRIDASLRPTDVAARIGGDEFLVLLPATRMPEAVQVAERLRLAVADSPMRVGHERVRITASFGIADLPPAIVSTEEVLTVTRLALKRSKAGGKNRVSVQGGASAGATEDLLAGLSDPRSYAPVAQPIHDLAGDEIAGWELLARRRTDPFRMPTDFFRLALEENCLVTTDLACLRAAVGTAGALPERLIAAVNVFPSTLLATPTDALMALLPAGRDWVLEVSEQQFIGDPAALRERTRALQERGVKIAVDDVGFGRTSLETLLVLEPDVIKVDRRYVHGVGTDRALRRQLARLVQAVSPLGATLIAEGVERGEDLEVVYASGIRFAQGFLFGQPAPP